MGLVKEFKQFISRGNVVDLAVGVIIGAAFGKIVSSFVTDILMPPIGLIIGGVNFTHLNVVLKEAAGDKPAVLFNYGNFIQVSIDFFIIAFAIFLFIKAFNSMKRKEEKLPEPPNPTGEERLLTEIRDLLKEKK
jgi:large conductance mechanosensitive channel